MKTARFRQITGHDLLQGDLLKLIRPVYFDLHNDITQYYIDPAELTFPIYLLFLGISPMFGGKYRVSFAPQFDFNIGNLTASFSMNQLRSHFKKLI